MSRLLLLSKVAIALGVSENHIRKLCDRQLVPFERVGRYRVFATDDLPVIRAACQRAGYLPTEGQPREAAHV